ncbi:thermonuclease family protein [Cereibacter sp. SYSU M97828]|nr:thermonuclease family protein [Cereibacter flavus]
MNLFNLGRRRRRRKTRGIKRLLVAGVVALPFLYTQIEPHLGTTAKAYATKAITFVQDLTRATGPSQSGTVSVIDGDTIDLHGTRIRLHGIDAPESRQTCTLPSGRDWRCGQEAALALSDRIGRASVECVEKDTDRYGRMVAVCYLGRENLNAWMVSEGWAVAYRQYSTDYVGAEAQARAGKAGIWSPAGLTCRGTGGGASRQRPPRSDPETRLDPPATAIATAPPACACAG